MKQKEKQKHNTEEIGKREKKKVNAIAIAAVCIVCSAAIGVGAGFALTKVKHNASNGVNVVVNSEDNKSDEKTEENKEETAQTNEEVKSNEQADVKFPKPSEENDLINIIAEAKRQGMTKRAYLTFDDGPSKKVTPEILDTLKKHNIKATFFEVGKMIKENPDMAKRVYDEGHLIANHSYSHDYNALYATEQSFSDEVTKTEQAIEEVTGEKLKFKLVRFPGGSYDNGDHAAEKQVYKKTLANMGYYFCDWNALNGDAEGKEKNAAELDAYFKKYAASYIEQDKNLIILMHDSDVKQATADALDGIIVYLAEHGYTFHRLDDIEWNEQ